MPKSAKVDHFDYRKAVAKRLPIGATKIEILLYLASNKEADSVDLKRYLEEKFDIKNKKNSYIHLTDLHDFGFVEKRSLGKGKSDVYYLPQNFHTFKDVFNHLKSQGKETELMKTAYFKTYIKSEDFRLKFVVHLSKEIALAMIASFATEEGYKSFLMKGNEKYNKELAELSNYIRSYKSVSQNSATIDNFLKLMEGADFSNKRKIKNIVNMGITLLKRTDVDAFTDYALQNELLASVIRKFSSLLMLEKEKTEIIAMLESSPSAINTVLNFDKADPISILGTWMRFMLWSVNDDPVKMETLSELLQYKEHFADNAQRIYDLLADFSKLSSKTPFYTITSSEFISDYINHKHVVPSDKDSELALSNVLNDILLPKIASGGTK